MPRQFVRFLPILCAMLLSMLVPVSAATISFTPVTGAGQSSITYQCTTSSQNAACNIDEADVDFRAGDDRLLDPSATFRFLEFEAKGTERGKKDDDDTAKGDTFTAFATLAFKLGNLNTIYQVSSKAIGSFTTKGGDFTSFSIKWDPIANLTIQGLGVFSFTFEDRLLTAIDEDDIYIRATMTQVSAVPLPAGAWLLLSGIAVLGAARMRRRAKA